MTSPGGNIVEIRVISRDMSGPGFDAATRRARGMAQAMSGGAGSVAGSMQEAEKRAVGLGGTLRRVGEVAGGVLVAGVVQQMAQRAVHLVKSTAQAASNLSESVNAVNQTFAEGAPEIVAWGEANANAIGLSRAAFQQSATVVGAMLKNQGLEMDSVTEHTTRLTERAADMASVFNTDVGDALAAIQAGLRGEIDPLERYGVSLSAAAVEQRALAMSGKTATRELTTQDKALARLTVLYEQTDQVAGDFRNTSDGMANSQRIATAQMEDAKAKIGTSFMPVLAKASQLTGKLAEQFGGLPGPVQIAAVAVIGLGGAIGFLGPKAMAAKAALDAMAASDSRVQRSMAKTAVVVGKAAGAIALLHVGVMAAGSAMGSGATPQVDALTESLTKFAETGENAGELTRLFGGDLKQLDKDFAALDSGTISRGSRAVADFVNALVPVDSLSGGSLTNMRKRIEAIDSALASLVREGRAEDAALVFEMLAARAEAAGVGLDDLRAGLPQYAAAMEVAAAKTEDVAEAAEEAAKSVDELDKAYDEIIDSAFALEEAQDAAAGAIEKLNKQLQQQKEDGDAGAGSLVGNTEAARDNRDAVRDLVSLYKDLMLEAQRSGQSTDHLAQELEDQLVSMGFARDEAQRYIESLKELQAELKKLEYQRIQIDIVENRRRGTGYQEFAHGGIPGAAGGGPRGARTWVGEQGPELVDLPYGSTVHSNGDSMRMAGQAAQSASAMSMEVNFTGDVDSAFATAFMGLVRTGRITIQAKAVQG